jgi:hypothetical protein
MLLVVRCILCLFLGIFASAAGARDIYVLVLGDQSAANCHARAYGSIPGVFLLGSDGRERLAADPLEWSDCKGGSIWLPLAARLKSQPGVDKVVLMPIAVRDAKLAQWIDGAAARRLNAGLAVAKARGIKFDYVLSQQGLADENTPANMYLNQMRTVIKSTTSQVKLDKWLIAQSRACLSTSLDGIDAARSRLSQQNLLNRFPGPTDSGIGRSERMPDCSLSELGQERMAQRWFESIKRADLLSTRRQKETLVYYFK